MKYTINRKRIEGGIFNLRIEFDPVDEVLGAFFQNSSWCFPDLLCRVASSTGFASEFSNYIPYSALDSEDFDTGQAFEKDEVKIRVYFGEVILNSSVFDFMLYEYAMALLEVYGDDTDLQRRFEIYLKPLTAESYWNRDHYLKLNPNWKLAMRDGIDRLKEKMGNQGIVI